MMWKNLLIAAALFFGWLVVDSIASIAGQPLEGVHYPMQSRRMLSNVYDEHNWTEKTRYIAPFFLAVFAVLWWYLMRRAGRFDGTRVAAIITAFVMVSFWVVPAVSADMYELELNGYWLASMMYCNAVFFLYGFIGRGTIEDMYF